MSVRRKPAKSHAELLQKELGELKQAAIQASVADSAPAEGAEANVSNAPSFDALTPVEKSAASLGVAPDQWKPM